MPKIKFFLGHVKKFAHRRRALALLVILVILSGSVGAFVIGDNGVSETVSIVRDDLVRNVKISGRVVPREKVDLSFEIVGTVSYVGKDVGSYVARGEVLARLDSSSRSAEILKSEAELASAQAELNKLEGKETFESSIANAKRSINQAIRDAYTAGSDAIYNKPDQVFIDPRSGRANNYTILGSFKDRDGLRDAINAGRISMDPILEDWETMVANLGSISYADRELVLSKEYLVKVTEFVSNVSRAVNQFEVTDWMTQSQIDRYKTDILSARDNLNKVAQKFIDSENALAKVLSDVPVQVARVEAARASLLNLRAELDKLTIDSPISGIVTKQEAKLGQAITAGSIIATVISSDYNIETFIPEVSIAGIKIANTASVTLDAYDLDQVFMARVTHIDPAETIRDGVSTYKVELVFNSADERIKSGMTANVEIEIFRKAGVLKIPERALVKDMERNFVYILEGGQSIKVPVELGERDLRGSVEVVSGLNSSDKVLISPPQD